MSVPKIYVCGAPLGHCMNEIPKIVKPVDLPPNFKMPKNIKPSQPKIQYNNYKEDENSDNESNSVEDSDYDDEYDSLLSEVRKLREENANLKEKLESYQKLMEDTIAEQMEKRVASKDLQINELKNLVNDLCGKLDAYKKENENIKKQNMMIKHESEQKEEEVKKAIKDCKRSEIINKRLQKSILDIHTDHSKDIRLMKERQDEIEKEKLEQKEFYLNEIAKYQKMENTIKKVESERDSALVQAKRIQDEAMDTETQMIGLQSHYEKKLQNYESEIAELTEEKNQLELTVSSLKEKESKYNNVLEHQNHEIQMYGLLQQELENQVEEYKQTIQSQYNELIQYRLTLHKARASQENQNQRFKEANRVKCLEHIIHTDTEIILQDKDSEINQLKNELNRYKEEQLQQQEEIERQNQSEKENQSNSRILKNKKRKPSFKTPFKEKSIQINNCVGNDAYI